MDWSTPLSSTSNNTNNDGMDFAFDNIWANKYNKDKDVINS